MQRLSRIGTRVVAVLAFAGLGAVAYGIAAAEASPPRLAVSHVSPDALGQGAARIFQITGSGFRHGITVSVSGTGVTVSATTLFSPTILKATLSAAPTASLGSRSVTLHEGATSSTLSGAFTVEPAPTLSLVTPSGVAGNGIRQVVSLTGSGFQLGMRARVSGAGILGGVANVTSPTQATVAIMVAPTAKLGPHQVTVTNPDLGTSASPPLLVVDPLPRITSVSNFSLSQGETTNATITGSHFQHGATVSLGAGVTTTVRSVTSTHITVTWTVGSFSPFGAHNLTVVNADLGRAVAVGAVHVGYVPIFSKYAIGDGATSFTTTLVRPLFGSLPSLSVTGTGITISGRSLNAGNQLVVTFAVSPSAATTYRNMTIQHGTTSWFVPNALKIRPAPTVTLVKPLAQGATSVGVTMSGADFEVCGAIEPAVSISGTGVTVNSVSATYGNLMYLNLTVTPSAPLGARDVTVTNCDSKGTATSSGVFTVDLPPTVTSVAPAVIGTIQTHLVTIMGTGFVNGASVIIGTGTARNVNLSLGAVHFISSTEVQVSVSAFPGATSETDDVSVKNPDSGVGTLSGSYLIDVVAPVVSLTAPSDGSSGVGTTPTFSGAAGEVAASSSSSADAPTITVYICSGTQTTCDANSAFLVQTLTTTESAGSWSVAPSTPLDASSPYTAEASQSDDAGNAGFSSATTFST